MLKLFTILVGVAFFAVSADAEVRHILVDLSDTEGKLVVTTGSTVPRESRRGMTIAEAADVLSRAEDSGSGVYVVIVSDSDTVDIRHLKPLLDAFEKNASLKLNYIRLGKSTKDFDASWR